MVLALKYKKYSKYSSQINAFSFFEESLVWNRIY